MSPSMNLRDLQLEEQYLDCEHAILRGAWGDIKEYADIGYDLGMYDNKLLHQACSLGHFEIVKIMAENDVNIADSEALRIASKHHQTEIAEYLESQGAYIDIDKNKLEAQEINSTAQANKEIMLN